MIANRKVPARWTENVDADQRVIGGRVTVLVPKGRGSEAVDPQQRVTVPAPTGMGNEIAAPQRMAHSGIVLAPKV